MYICSQRVHFRMPRKYLRKTYNFNLRKQGSSQENIEENPPKQDSRTSPSKETLHLDRPTRVAKVRCIQNVSKIIRLERSYDYCATETFEQRQQRLENRRLRALRESVEQREKRLENIRRRAAHRIATESFEQRQQRLEKRRLRASRVASGSVEQRKQRLEYFRRYWAHRVATESDEQHQQRLEKQRLHKRCRARLGRPAPVMEHGANECTEELLHSEIIIKTEVDEAAQSCDYFVVEFDLNQVKEKPGLVQYAKSEPALLVKEEILEDSGEDGKEQQSVQGTPIPAGTRSVNEACSARLGDLINIKHEPSDVDVGPTVLQHMDIHYTINKLDVDAIKQEDALLSLDTEEALSTINNGQCVHSKVKDETIDDSQEERGYSIKRSRIRKDYSRNPSRKHHILQD